MMIALPNPDKSFTCTLFAPYEGAGGFNDVTTRDQIVAHFRHYFPDVLTVMPDYIEDYLKNPTGALATMEVSPWCKDGKMLLIGDAAHAVRYTHFGSRFTGAIFAHERIEFNTHRHI